MRQGVVDVSCDAASASELARALRAYAHAAYPPGGSECAQVARDTLLDTAALCERHTAGTLQLRKRQLPVLRAAVRWWLSETTRVGVESPRGLKPLLTTLKKSA